MRATLSVALTINSQLLGAYTGKQTQGAYTGKQTQEVCESQRA
jgi:hypothetical protein